MKKFYITSTLPYVNAEPHIGFALEMVQADAIARYQRQQGLEVFFNTGTDEHGLKIYRQAEEAGKNIQAYVDGHADKFDKLKSALDLSYDAFIRTTDPHHIKAVQYFWQLCDKKGDIYKKNYKIKYCVGCELEKTESELVDDRCPLHPNKELEIIEEENYFFKFSNYQGKLLKLYDDNPGFVVPDYRLTEIRNFVKNGLEDFSISRLKSKMPWGVEVPGDPDHVMYVWFDALINYISTLGWPESEKFKEFWPGLQVAGKDNLRQQSAMWQAMLMSADLPTTKQIFIHGFINIAGGKMSKSLGNVVDPFKLVEKYGTEPVRYYLLRYIHPVQDSDFSIEQFEESYTADLANGLGNLVNRITGLVEQNDIELKLDKFEEDKKFKSMLENFEFDKALKYIWELVAKADGIISEKKPWELAKKGRDKEVKKILEEVANLVYQVSQLLIPFLPETAKKIEDIITAEKIIKGEALFPRLE